MQVSSYKAKRDDEFVALRKELTLGMRGPDVGDEDDDRWITSAMKHAEIVDDVNGLCVCV